MKIDIDNRERLRIPKFQKYINSGKPKFITGFDLSNMLTGDYGTQDFLVGIEYKRDDLTDSIFNNQIDKQLKELSDAYTHAYLFIGYDGISEMITENIGVNPDCLIGKLTSILARNHVSVMFVGDLLVRFVVDVVEKHYDLKNQVKSYSPIRNTYQRKNASIAEIKLDIISRIPKLGQKKANILLENFNYSFKNIIKASTEEIENLKGFGPNLSKRIKEVFA